MKIIWVLENIKGTVDFYSKLNTLILITSIKQWKKYHPEDNCVLYCDKLTKELFDKSNISMKAFDENFTSFNNTERKKNNIPK